MKPLPPFRSTLRRTLTLTTALGSVLLALPAMADPAAGARPQGGSVAAGTATINRGATETRVTQGSVRAVIDWTGFDVGAGQSVTFVQPGAQSVVLNRVSTASPSQIAGRISANGQVVIENRSGVVFTGSAEIDAQALVVSAAGITNSAFMAGSTRFDQPARPGAEVVNQGRITVREAGLVALVAPSVRNSGVIEARAGRVILAGAETHAVDLYGDGLLSIETAASAATVRNTGRISADGGRVLLTVAQADGIVTGLVEAGGQISARTNKTGSGSVAIRATGGSVVVDGRVLASGRSDGQRGGTIEIAATGTVTLGAQARLDASGAAGGGRIAIGEAQGLTATVTQIQPGARIAADAARQGNGGTIRVMSSRQTSAAGAISARGGAAGGAGGTIEVSGAGGLALTASLDAGAPKGMAGTVLIDPQDLVILSGGGAGLFIPAGGGGSLGAADNGGSATPVTATLDPAVLSGLTGTVVLQAARDLTVLSALNSAATSLSLQAGRNLAVNAPVGLTGGGTLSLAAATAGFAGMPGYDAGGTAGSLTIGATGGIAAPGARVLLSAGSGGIASSAAIDAGSLVLATTGGGAVNIPTIISAGTVSIPQAGAVSLGGANRIGTLTGIQSSGGIILRDSVALLLQGPVTATGAGNAVSLRSADGIRVAPGGAVTADGLVILTAQPTPGAGAGTIWTQGAITSLQDSVLLAAGRGGLAIGAPVTAGAGQVVSMIGDAYVNTAPVSNTISAPGGTIAIAPFSAGGAFVLGPGGVLGLAGTTGMTASVLVPGGILLPGGGAAVPVAGSIVVTGFDAAGIPVLHLATRGAVTQTAPLVNVARLEIDAASVTLAAANTIATLGATTVGGDLLIATAQGLAVAGAVGAASIRLEVDGGLAIGQPGTPGTLNSARVALIASGTISEPNGAITAGLLLGPQAGDAHPHAATALLRGDNAVTTLGAFTVLGDFALVNNTDLAIAGAVVAGTVPAPAIGNTATIDLVVNGGLVIGSGSAPGVLGAGRVNLLASGFISEPAGAIRANLLTGPAPGLAVTTATAVQLGGANQVTQIGGFTAVGDLLIANTRSIVIKGTLQAGAGPGNAGGNTATLELDTQGDLQIGQTGGAAVLSGGTVALVAGGTISQPNGQVLAGLLLGPGAGTAIAQAAAVQLDGINVINRLGRFATTGAFILADGGALAVTGTVAAGASLTLAAGGDLMIGQGGAAGLLSAAAVSLLAPGTIAEAANGAILADLLSGPGTATSYRASAVSLVGANQIARLGGIVAAGDLVLHDQASLIVVGNLVAGAATPAGAANTALLGLAVTGDLALGAAATPVRLSGGTIALGAGGTISAPAGVLSASLLTQYLPAGFAALPTRIDLAGANTLAVVGPLSSRGDLTVASTTALTTAGTVSAGGVLAPDPANTGVLTLAVGGDIAIGGPLRPAVLSAGTVVLRGAGRIDEPNGAILANLLQLPAPGQPQPSAARIVLGGNNQLTRLGAASAAGDIVVNARGSLAVTGTLQAGGGIVLIVGSDLAIGAPIIAGSVLLGAGGTISEPGGLIATAYLVGPDAAHPAAAAMLTGGNRIDALGDFTATGAMTLTDSTALAIGGRVTAGMLSLGAGGPITLAGSLTAGSVALSTAGTIAELASGSVVTGWLSGPNPLATIPAAAAVILTGRNRISMLGPLAATGDIALANGSDLVIAGTVTARDPLAAGGAPSHVAIAVAGGSLSLGIPGSAGVLDAGIVAIAAQSGITAPNGRIIAGLLTDQTGIASSPTSAAIALTGANQIDSMGQIATTTGPLRLTVTGDLAVAGPVTAAGTLTLASTGGAVFQSGGIVVVPALSGAAASAFLFEAPGNRIDVLGAIQAGSRVVLQNSAVLTVGGPVTVGSDGSIALAAPALILGGVMTAPGAAGQLVLNATAGGIVQTGGGLDVTLLAASAALGIALDNTAAANHIAVATTLRADGGALGVANQSALFVTGSVRGLGVVSLASAVDLDLGGAAVVTTNIPAAGTSVGFASPESNTGSVQLAAGRNVGIQPGALVRAALVSATAGGAVLDSGEIAANLIQFGGLGGAPVTLAALGNGAWLSAGGGSFAGPLSPTRWPTPTSAGGGVFVNAVNFSVAGTAMLVNAWGQSAPLFRLDLAGAGSLDAMGGLWAKTATVFFNLGRHASLSGHLDAAALYVAYPRGGEGAAELSGTLRGVGGQAAAQIAVIQPAPNAVYRLNGCAIASVSCFVVSTERLPQTVPTRDLDIRPARDTTDDTEVLLPNVSRRDL